MEIKNVVFHYPKTKKTAFEAADVQITSGKITTILGPNGSGKSTLMKLMTGSLVPKKGEVLVNQQNLQDLSHKARAKQLAYLSQQQLIPADMTVEGMVCLGRIPYQNFFLTLTKKDWLLVNEALAYCELTEKRHLLVTELSGGEQQRVALAQVIAQDTPYIFLDEPTTYLDVYYEYEFLKLVQKLQREKNKTVIMILHNLQHALRFSDEIILVSKGKMKAQYDLAEQMIPIETLRTVYQLPFGYATHATEQYLVIQDEFG
jgi:iron complex transport system ATP-binding protein